MKKKIVILKILLPPPQTGALIVSNTWERGAMSIPTRVGMLLRNDFGNFYNKNYSPLQNRTNIQEQQLSLSFKIIIFDKKF